MRLLNLRLLYSYNNKTIRNIKFNFKNISLIIDEKTETNLIGEFFIFKLIDFCLGSKSVKSLYTRKSNEEDLILKQFLLKNKIRVELTCLIEKNEFVFSRDLFTFGNYFINGEKVKNLVEYNKKLNIIIFDNKANEISFRKLINKFLSFDRTLNSDFLKYLGPFCNDTQYNEIYYKLFGLHSDGISANKKSLNEKKNLMEQITTFSDKKSVLSLEIFLLEEQIKKNRINRFEFNIKELRTLYEETKLNFEKKICDFETLVIFNNDMLEKRNIFLRKELNLKNETLKTIDNNLNDFYNKYCQIEKIEKNKHKNYKIKELKRSEIEFNNFFNSYVKIIIGESINLSFTNSFQKNTSCKRDEFFISMNKTKNCLGEGFNEILFICFDLSFINYMIKNNLKAPFFFIHGNMKTVDSESLVKIIKISRTFEGQFIFPLSRDKLNLLNIQEKEIIFRSLPFDTFFNIKS